MLQPFFTRASATDWLLLVLCDGWMSSLIAELSFVVKQGVLSCLLILFMVIYVY